MTTVFEKHGTPEALAVEASRTSAAAQVALKTGLFRVPSVRSLGSTSLGLERIDGISSVREVLPALGGRAEREELVGQLGAALAAIHLRFEPGQGSRRNGPGRWLHLDPVPVHGDFGVTNTQVAGDGSIVILDWMAPAWAPWLPVRASSHWDLALFLVDLNYQRPGEPRRVPDTRSLAGSFIAGYRQLRPISLSDLRRSTAEMTVQYYRGAACGARSALRLPSSIRLLL